MHTMKLCTVVLYALFDIMNYIYKYIIWKLYVKNTQIYTPHIHYYYIEYIERKIY